MINYQWKVFNLFSCYVFTKFWIFLFLSCVTHLCMSKRTQKTYAWTITWFHKGHNMITLSNQLHFGTSGKKKWGNGGSGKRTIKKKNCNKNYNKPLTLTETRLIEICFHVFDMIDCAITLMNRTRSFLTPTLLISIMDFHAHIP